MGSDSNVLSLSNHNLYPSNGEGDEEETCEQDCKGEVLQGVGAPRQQGEDCWRPDEKGLHQEQVRQGREQEAERQRQAQPVDPGMQEGTCIPEDQRLCRVQEGDSLLPKGEGVLRPVSAACSRRFE